MCSPWNRNTSSILASQQVSEPWIGPMPNLVWEALQSWRELLRKIPPGEVRGKQRNEVGRWGTGIWERDGRTEGVVGEECLKATTWGNVSHMLWMACSFFFFSIKDLIYSSIWKHSTMKPAIRCCLYCARDHAHTAILFSEDLKCQWLIV